MTIGEEAVVANTLEPIRKDVEQKATQELVRVEPHDLRLRSVGIVAPVESDVGVVEGDEAPGSRWRCGGYSG